jgi:hypothetical protein
MEYRILKDYPYQNTYGQYVYSSTDDFYKNTGINSKEFGDDLYVIRENISVDGNSIDLYGKMLYCPFYSKIYSVESYNDLPDYICDDGDVDCLVENASCTGLYYYEPDDISFEFDPSIHCCVTDINSIKSRRILLEVYTQDYTNLQIYYDKNDEFENYNNSTAPNIVTLNAHIVLEDNFIPIIQDNVDFIASTIYIAEWGDETSFKDKETLISEFTDKNKYEKFALGSQISHFYQEPGIKVIKGFYEIISSVDTESTCPYFVSNWPSIDELYTACANNINCSQYTFMYNDTNNPNYYGGGLHGPWVGYGAPTTTGESLHGHVDVYYGGSKLVTLEIPAGSSHNQAVTWTTVWLWNHYCSTFASVGDNAYPPWDIVYSISTVDYFEAKINLNVDEVYKDEFSEIGGIGFDYLPWPETSPVIGGISDESKYINDVINIVNQNQFKETEVLDKQKALDALENDELGNHIGKVDISQTRMFMGVYTMDDLLDTVENDGVDSYTPYNNFNYWCGYIDTCNGDTVNTYPLYSSVGLLFINDSVDSNLRDTCIIEFNFGDTDDDIIIDTAGQNNKGIIIGDYSLQKPSKETPLIRDDVMTTPVIDIENGAF